MQRCAAKAQQENLPCGRETLDSSFTESQNVLDRLLNGLGEIVEARLIRRILDQLPQIFASETSGSQVALKDDLLTELYISGYSISSGGATRMF